METPVDIRYAGVVIGRAHEVRNEERALFLFFPEPLPVGTVIGLGGDDTFARVHRIVESQDATQAGMLVRRLERGQELLPPEPQENVEVAPMSRLPEVLALVEPTPAPVVIAPPMAARPPAEPEPPAAEPERPPVEVPSAAFSDAAPSVISSELSEAVSGPSDSTEEPDPNLGGDLPPARPIASPDGRRRRSGKRRR